VFRDGGAYENVVVTGNSGCTESRRVVGECAREGLTERQRERENDCERVGGTS